MKSLSKVITLKSNCFPSLMPCRLFISIRDFYKNNIPLRINLLTFSRKKKLCTLVIEHYTKFFDSLVLCQMIRKRPLYNQQVTDSSLFVKKYEADSFTLKELLSNIAPRSQRLVTHQIYLPLLTRAGLHFYLRIKGSLLNANKPATFYFPK